MNPALPEFQRAFLAAAYCVGARGEALLKPLAEPSARALELAIELAAEERGQRARVLAAELEIVARHLSKLGLGA
jgi:hypothetical protein